MLIDERSELLQTGRYSSVSDVLFSSYGLSRWFLIIAIPFGINLGVNYLLHRGDYVGVFKPPVLFSNFLRVFAFLLTYFCSVLAVCFRQYRTQKTPSQWA